MPTNQQCHCRCRSKGKLHILRPSHETKKPKIGSRPLIFHHFQPENSQWCRDKHRMKKSITWQDISKELASRIRTRMGTRTASYLCVSGWNWWWREGTTQRSAATWTARCWSPGTTSCRYCCWVLSDNRGSCVACPVSPPARTAPARTSTYTGSEQFCRVTSAPSFSKQSSCRYVAARCRWF